MATDIHVQSNGQTTTLYARVRAHFAGWRGLQVVVRRRNVFDRIGEALGFGRRLPVAASLLERYVVKGKPEARVPSLFTGPGLVEAIVSAQSLRLQVKRPGRRERKRYGQDSRRRKVMDLNSFEALTFDCYGTLIDWERGLLDALAPVLAADGVAHPGDDALLERFALRESEAQAGPYRSYRSVLEEVLRGLGSDLGFFPTREQLQAFGASVAFWPPFADTVPALQVLGARYRLAVVSNVDDDLFAGSAARLGAGFAEVVTAQQVRSYKPAPGHFHEVLRRLGLPREKVLHVAQSLFHDVAPAKALGFTCVWVNRRSGRAGGGATAPARATPDLEVPDLAALAALVARTGA